MNTNGKVVFKYRTQLMGVAAVLVYIYHIWNPLFGKIPVVGNIERFIKVSGYDGVDLFFMLSGMGLVFAIEKGNILQFYGRRIKHIVIPFWIIGIVNAITVPWTFLGFLANVTGYSFIAISLYSYLWFVPAIMILYLLFPLYYWFFKKAQNKLFFTLFVLEVWWALTIGLGGILRADLYAFTNRIPVFILGVLLGYYFKEKNIVFTRDHVICMIATLCLGIVLLYMCIYNDFFILVPISKCCLPPLLIAISGIPLMAILFDKVSKINGIRSVKKTVRKVLTFFGTISLEIYCVQELLGNPVNRSLTEDSNLILINIVLFIVISLAAYILHLINIYFWMLVERVVILCTKRQTSGK